MINLRIRTEYSFGETYAPIDRVIARLKEIGCTAAGIVDKQSTWGHCKWFKKCKDAGIQPLLGVELVVAEEEDQRTAMWFLARNTEGLQELYRWASKTYQQPLPGKRGSIPALRHADVLKMSINIFKFAGDILNKEFLMEAGAYADISPSSRVLAMQKRALGLPIVGVGDNYYARQEDEQLFEIIGGSKKPSPQYILSELEGQEVAKEIADACVSLALPKAPMLRAEGDLEKLCRDGIVLRKLDWNDVYEERLTRELNLIRSKDFDAYFIVVADMVEDAKKKMLVGPSRGSSAGSLVCYLTRITEVDPIPHGLFFERFIDITRSDLPDIDLDFSDNKRHLVFEYMADRYGADNTAHIGTISLFKPKSALVQVCKKLDISPRATAAVKVAMIERGIADARTGNCLEDTLLTTEPGKQLLASYPSVMMAASLEGHASHCVSGEGSVLKSNGQKIKIKNLWEIYNGVGKLHNKLVRGQGSKIKIRAYDLKKEILFFDEIKGVYKTGIKKTLEITTKRNKIRLTHDHLILSKMYGWIEAGKLKEGEFISKNGVFKKGCAPRNKGLKGSQVAWNKGLKQVETSERMKLNNPMKNAEVVEKAIKSKTKHGRNCKNTLKYIKENATCEECLSKPSKHLHHIDEDPFNNPADNSNFKALCVSCHNKIHGKGWFSARNWNLKTNQTISWTKILCVKEHGEEVVYDISMKGESHNFICCGTVVHNCGTHAAGLLVCNDKITNYCTVDANGIAHIEKGSAEDLGLLKIDVLGLRTLGILEDSGVDVDWYNLPLDDPKVFEVFNKGLLSCIFQFEGKALRSLSKNIKFDSIVEVDAITALARPGPFGAGIVQEYLSRKNGKPYQPIHPLVEEKMKDTFGLPLYQENTMDIVRNIGKFSWEDTSFIRKAISKRLGKEFFEKFWPTFKNGAAEQGIDEEAALKVWELINSMGSWQMNRCISANTKIRFAANGGMVPTWMTIEDAYEKYVTNKSAWIRQHKSMPRLISLFPDGRGHSQNAFAIHRNGKKRCWEYSFDNGETVTCTKDHKFLINKKWACIGSAKIKDEFTILIRELDFNKRRGNPAKGKRWNIKNNNRAGENNIGYVNGKTKAEKDFRIYKKKSPCDDCGNPPTNRMEVHHNDNDGGRIRPKDLAWLCSGCHKKRHYADGSRKTPLALGHKQATIKLIGKRYAGMQETYDIEMPEHHNFVINGGLVTHNSHTRSYAIISIWCAWLKAYWPIEFAAANLRNAKDADSALELLREMHKEGIKHVAFDLEKSEENWSAKDGVLFGGFLNLHGFGEAKAKKFVAARNLGALTAKMREDIAKAKNTFADIFPFRTKYGQMYDDPAGNGLGGELVNIVEFDGTQEGSYLFAGEIVYRNQRDANEEVNVKKRGGKLEKGQTQFLDLRLRDDTATIGARIHKRDFERMGRDILENVPEGAHLLIRAKFIKSIPFGFIQKLKILYDGKS